MSESRWGWRRGTRQERIEGVNDDAPLTGPQPTARGRNGPPSEEETIDYINRAQEAMTTPDPPPEGRLSRFLRRRGL